jgi:hypothetical protein
MKRVLVLAALAATALGLVALGSTPALAGPGKGKFVTGNQTGTTTTLPGAQSWLFTSSSTGTLNAKSPFGTLSYVRTGAQDWSGASWPANPCAVVTGSVTYTAVSGGAGTFTVTLSGTTCEVAVGGVFNNTKYSSTLIETITAGAGTGRFAGVTGSLTTTGTSTGPSPPTGSFADTFKTNGTVFGL